MEWYRRYHGTCRDQKLEMVARAAGVPRPFAIAAWDGVLEYASAHEDRGSIAGLTAEWLSITIGCEEEEAKKLLRAMIDKGLVSRDPSRVVAWDKRQPGDPTAAERMKRMRDRKRASDRAVTETPNGSEAVANGDDGYDVTDVTDRNGVTTISEQSRTEEIASHVDSESCERSAAPPLPDLKAATWRAVVGLLGPSSRSLVGQWARDYGDAAVYDAYNAYRAAAAGGEKAEPKGYLIGILEHHAGRRGADRSPMASHKRVMAMLDGEQPPPSQSERRALAMYYAEPGAETLQ